MLVGHQQVAETLCSQLPAVSIISGPKSVGKRLIAARAAISNSVERTDFLEVSRLTVDESSRIKSFMSSAPLGAVRFALINLDGATKQAVDKLLITLENPPEYAKFCLICSTRVPRTLRTRAEQYTVGLLDPEDLLNILVNKGITVAEATRLSKLGRVDLALNVYKNTAAKHIAVNVLQAAESMDYILLMQAFKAVDDDSAHMLLVALEESASQIWKIFTPEQLGGFAKKEVALKLLNIWSSVSGARPQLAMRIVLESIMRG